MSHGLRRPLAKRILLGRALASRDAAHQLLPKTLALPVFASDALSSVAYATEEILHVLIGAVVVSPAILGRSIPIAIAVSTLMTIVIVSYRQTVRAYPGGGGAYIVSKENLGQMPGLIAGASLLIDYILTVSVSIAAGTFALTSLAPSLAGNKVPISLGFVALITIANLRGTRESGALFALPTYAFIVSIVAMLIVGFARCAASGCPQVDTTVLHVEIHPAVPGLWLLLRAFASGSTALTGVEAIANGVPAFRGRRPRDQARNAATTLAMLGAIAITMFIGITTAANRMGARPAANKSVVAQVADATFGGGFGFVAVQIATVLILVLAANTAFQDFPRLSSILAKDRFMPRQFINRGDRLVFSNGIVVLAVVAGLLIVLFDAEVTRLIQLYVVGVFTSFTLSQAGMVVRWRRLRDPGWRRLVALNGVGALTTGVVLAVVAATKFAKGAWIVVVAAPLIILMFKAIHRHYESVARQLRLPSKRPREIARTRALLLVARLDAVTLRALGYARSLRPMELKALHVGRGVEAEALAEAWTARALPVPLEIVDGDPQGPVDPIRAHIRGLTLGEDEMLTAVVPEVVFRSKVAHYLRRRRTLLLKAALLFERRVALTDVTLPEGEGNETAALVAPTRVIAIVLVSAVHNATLRALEYARSLSPTELRAVSFNVDPDETDRILREWGSTVDDVGLEVVDSPYREVTRPLVRYTRAIRATTPDATVAVIIPEFVVRRYWHQFLHNQTALAIKGALLFEPGVVVTSVPYHLR